MSDTISTEDLTYPSVSVAVLNDLLEKFDKLEGQSIWTTVFFSLTKESRVFECLIQTSSNFYISELYSDCFVIGYLDTSVQVSSRTSGFEALALLELGRCNITNLKLRLQSDLTLLEKEYPSIAQEFTTIRNELTLAWGNISQKSGNPHNLGDSLRRAEVHFESLVTQIRGCPGFERFLRGPSESELKELAKYGAILAFNVSDLRGDAFIVTEHDINVIALSGFTIYEAATYAARFRNAVDNKNIPNYLKSNREVKEVLEWLWDVAVSPCLEALGYTRPPSKHEVWPRVWWIGSNLLHTLPIHAAGYHEPGSNNRAIDRVVSSYVPSFRSLQHARRRAKSVLDLTPQSAVLVGMPTTPEFNDLGFVRVEIEYLKTLFETKIRCITPNPTRQEVVSIQVSEIQCIPLQLSNFSYNNTDVLWMDKNRG